MKKLLSLLLLCLMVAGCAAAPADPETTVPQRASTSDTTAASTEVTVAPDPLALVLDSMTLSQKVGQLFLCAPEQVLTDADTVVSMDQALEDALTRYPLGGIVLFAKNIRTPEQLTALNQALKNIGDIPMFLAVDEEGGLVARLGNHEAFDLPRYKSAAAVGADCDPTDALEMGSTIGAYLYQYGFNLNFAPVADVNTNPSNPVIGTRAFSDHPEVAARMVAAFAAGLREEGICATFKHFPGHGDTNQDSHTGLAVSYRNREELESCEWLPFRQATFLDLVMTAHVALPEITGDMTPSTLSREVVTGILREELGFEGLIITDAMNMGAIAETYSSGEAAVAALQAGCDIILMPEDLPEAFDAVLAALENGVLTESWLNDTVYRILEFKQMHGFFA